MKPDQLCQNYPAAPTGLPWSILRPKRAVHSQMVSLNDARVWSAHLAAGTTLCCLQGICWVTQQGKLGDVILRSGEEMTLDKSTFVVVSALGQKGEIPVAEIRINLT